MNRIDKRSSMRALGNDIIRKCKYCIGIVIVALSIQSCIGGGKTVEDSYDANYDAILYKIENDPAWKVWLDAASAAQHAYYLIVDTPIRQLNSDSSGVAAAVTDARDKYRKAKSYVIDNTYVSNRAQGEVEAQGVMISYAYKRVKSLDSSRGQRIFSILASGQTNVSYPFSDIVQEDRINIEDLIVNIKR